MSVLQAPLLAKIVAQRCPYMHLLSKHPLLQISGSCCLYLMQKSTKQCAITWNAKSRNNPQLVLRVQVISVAQTFCAVWETVGTLLAELDLLAAFADLAVNAPTPYVRPTMLESGEAKIELKGSR